MTQQLIEWMEEQKNENPRDYLLFEHYNAAIAKAKELQATEQSKWAVVHESAIFSDLEQAVKEKEDLGGIQSDYTIVKIIEP